MKKNTGVTPPSRFWSFVENFGKHFNRHRPTYTIAKLYEMAAADSAKFIQGHLATASLFLDRDTFHDWITTVCFPRLPKGLFLEFGVYQGDSLDYFAGHLESAMPANGKIYGFDAFQGLRNNWSNVNTGKGSLGLGGKVPKVSRNAELVVGWVEDTLDDFLMKRPEKVSFVHMDLDVYEPTSFVVQRLIERLQPGTVIVFDQFYGYVGWEHYEKKVYDELLSNIPHEWIAFAEVCQAALRIK